MNKTLNRTRAFFAATVLFAATLGASTASAQYYGSGVRVFVNPNFGGPSMTIRGDTPDLRNINMNDRITSIEIPDGEAWEVCQDINYENQCQVLTSSVTDLREMGWNDRISSIRRVSTNRGYRNRPYTGTSGAYNRGIGATVFTGTNFRGASSSFRNDTPDLRNFNLNDRIMSIEIPDGEAWEICQDVDYGNQCQVLTESVNDLRSIGWGNRISSLRRVGRGSSYRGPVGTSGEAGLVFYNRPNFRGASTLVSSNRSNAAFLARSIEVRGRGAWQVCDTNSECATIDQDVTDVSQLGLNGRIASVRSVNSLNRRVPWIR